LPRRQALISAIPEPAQRGSFGAIGASLQQLSGGLSSVLATAAISLVLMYLVRRPIAAQAGKRVM
jgi:hypothetical protein